MAQMLLLQADDVVQIHPREMDLSEMWSMVMVTEYKFNADMMETIFQELAIALMDNKDSPPAFSGPRCSDNSFALALAREVNEVSKVVVEGVEMPYESVVYIASMAIEWLMWMRWNGVIERNMR